MPAQYHEAPMDLGFVRARRPYAAPADTRRNPVEHRPRSEAPPGLTRGVRVAAVELVKIPRDNEFS